MTAMALEIRELRSAVTNLSGLHSSPPGMAHTSGSARALRGLVSKPPFDQRPDELETDPFGFQGRHLGHEFHQFCEQGEDWLANMCVRASTESERTSYRQHLRHLVMMDRLDTAKGDGLLDLTPLGGRIGAGTEIELGDGLKITNRVKTAHCPPQGHLAQYWTARVRELHAQLVAPSGERALTGPWGPHRLWQSKWRVTVYQLLQSVVTHVTTNLIFDCLSWSETWCLLGLLVGKYFRRPLSAPGDLVRALLEFAEEATAADLVSPFHGSTVLSNLADRFASTELMAAARRVAFAVAPNPSAVSVIDAPLPASAGGGGGGGGTPPADPAAKTVSFCGVPGCSYQHPGWLCTHPFTVMCDNRVAGARCGIAHARSGERKWPCKNAAAARSVLSASEFAAALKLSETAWRASTPAKLAAYVTKLG